MGNFREQKGSGAFDNQPCDNLPSPGKRNAPECSATVLRNGPNTVSGSTVSNTELSEFFWAHRVPGSELSEFLSAFYLCVNANSPSFLQNSPSLP